MFSEYSRPEVRFVRGGTLDDPRAIAPDVHIFTRSKLGVGDAPGVRAGVRRLLRHAKLWPAESLERLQAVLG